MGKYKYLLNNIALFTISNFVSKILVFLLVPFYTGILSTSDYGTADVMQTTLLLLVPALTVNMGEAALRFGIEFPDKRRSIFSVGLSYIIRADLMVLAAGAVLAFFLPGTLVLFFILLFFSNSFYEFLILFFQGAEKVKIVVAGSVFSTVILITSNIILLLFIKLGLYGYLISQILSFSFASALMLFFGKGLILPDMEDTPGKGESVKEDEGIRKEMAGYGRPMILYSTGAWVNNAADRYLVSLMCGLSVNGIYGVAYKIPSILTVFQRIFAQAWQMSATKVKDENRSEEFYSEMFHIYLSFMTIGCGGLILFSRPLSAFLFRKDFFEAWRYVPPLLISVVFGAMTGFLGSICLAHKDSRAMGKATGAGALINIGLNLILIPGLSAMGAALATGVSYFVMSAMALFYVRKHVTLKINTVRTVFSLVFLILQGIVIVTSEGSLAGYVLGGALLLILIVLNFKDIISIVKKIVKTGSGRPNE